VYDPESPMADNRGRVLEHRYVMGKSLGRDLEKTEIVHHKDGNRRNNVINNLELMNNGSHTTLHHPKTAVKTFCSKCGEIIERTKGKINGKLTFCSRSCSSSYYTSRRPKKEITHGTTGYRRGCRCDICREAQRNRVKQWRSR